MRDLTLYLLCAITITFAPSSTYGQDQSPASPPEPLIAPFSKEEAVESQAAWGKALETPVEVTNSLGMKLILIPPGDFLMGSKIPVLGRWKLHPQHRVRLTRAIYIGATEVTQGQYEEVMGDSPWAGPGLAKANQVHAASWIDWNEANEFCRLLSEREGVRYRLPTEAEWEFACRAGTTTVFHFGDAPDQLDDHAWHAGNASNIGNNYPHPVGRKKPNAFGLFDMHGNVQEWCSDNYDPAYYEYSPANDPLGADKSTKRSYRGGAWYLKPKSLRSAGRNGIEIDMGLHFSGLRVVRVPPRSEVIVAAKRDEPDRTPPTYPPAPEEAKQALLEAFERISLPKENQDILLEYWLTGQSNVQFGRLRDSWFMVMRDERTHEPLFNAFRIITIDPALDPEASAASQMGLKLLLASEADLKLPIQKAMWEAAHLHDPYLPGELRKIVDGVKARRIREAEEAKRAEALGRLLKIAGGITAGLLPLLLAFAWIRRKRSAQSE